jgi:hypothetical protein
VDVEFFSDSEAGVTIDERCCSRGSGVLNKENDDWHASGCKLMFANQSCEE